MKIEIIQTPEDHDSNNVVWIKDGERIGYGYQSKDDLKIHIVKCPKCDTENYALQQAVGPCYKCGFDPNKEGGEE